MALDWEKLEDGSFQAEGEFNVIYRVWCNPNTFVQGSYWTVSVHPLNGDIGRSFRKAKEAKEHCERIDWLLGEVLR